MPAALLSALRPRARSPRLARSLPMSARSRHGWPGRRAHCWRRKRWTSRMVAPTATRHPGQAGESSLAVGAIGWCCCAFLLDRLRRFHGRAPPKVIELQRVVATLGKRLASTRRRRGMAKSQKQPQRYRFRKGLRVPCALRRAANRRRSQGPEATPVAPRARARGLRAKGRPRLHRHPRRGRLASGHNAVTGWRCMPGCAAVPRSGQWGGVARFAKACCGAAGSIRGRGTPG